MPLITFIIFKAINEIENIYYCNLLVLVFFKDSFWNWLAGHWFTSKKSIFIPELKRPSWKASILKIATATEGHFRSAYFYYCEISLTFHWERKYAELWEKVLEIFQEATLCPEEIKFIDEALFWLRALWRIIIKRSKNSKRVKVKKRFYSFKKEFKKCFKKSNVVKQHNCQIIVWKRWKRRNNPENGQPYKVWVLEFFPTYFFDMW